MATINEVDEETMEGLEELEELEEELRAVRRDALAMQTQAKAKDGEEELEMERNGQTITVTEADLWDELKDKEAPPAAKKQAKELLKERHEGVFDKLVEERELSEAVASKWQEIFGFPFSKMSPGRFAKTVQAFVKYYQE